MRLVSNRRMIPRPGLLGKHSFSKLGRIVGKNQRSRVARRRNAHRGELISQPLLKCRALHFHPKT